MIYFYSKTN